MVVEDSADILSVVPRGLQRRGFEVLPCADGEIALRTFARELPGLLPAGSRCTTLHIPRGKGLLTPATLPAYKAEARALAAQFARMDVDVVAYGCTAAGFIDGPAGDARLARELAAVTGKKIVTTAHSMVLGLKEIGARQIALVTPYLDAVNDQLKAFLADGGVAVRRFKSFFAPDVEALGRIESAAVARLARRRSRICYLTRSKACPKEKVP